MYTLFIFAGPWEEIEVANATELDVDNITISTIVTGGPSYSSLIFGYNGHRSPPIPFKNITPKDVREMHQQGQLFLFTQPI